MKGGIIMNRTLLAGLLSFLFLIGPPVSTPTLSSTAVPPPVVVTLAGDSIADGGWQGGGVRLSDRIADRVWGGTDHTRMLTATEGGMCLIAAGCIGAPLVDRWASILAAGPSTVIVLVGTNDLSHVDDSAMQQAYTQLVNQAAAAGTRVLLCTILPRGENQWTTYWWWGPQRQRMNDWLRATYPNDLVDADAVLRRPDGWADMRWFADDIHPSWSGAVLISDAVPLWRIQ